MKAARLLLERGADTLAEDEAGWTPLHWAAYGGSAEIIDLLLARGAPVDARTSRGRRGIHPVYWSDEPARLTPLHLAVQSESLKAAQELVEHGADVNARDAQGQTVLDWCNDCGADDIGRLLRQHGANPKSP